MTNANCKVSIPRAFRTIVMRDEMKLVRKWYFLFLLQVAIALGLIAGIQPASAQPTSNRSSAIVIDASGAVPPPYTSDLKMSGRSSSGHEIKVNSHYLA